MSRKKISTTIYVTPEQNETLRLLHERTKVPVAVYIREGIDLVLKQYAHLLPGQLALEGRPLPVDEGAAASSSPRTRSDGTSPASPGRGSHQADSAGSAASDEPERAASGGK
jgi:hypothetical protein